MTLHFEQFLCLTDNIGLLAHDPASGATAAIDAPDAKAILDALTRKSWTLTDVFLTHHHPDHTQGVAALQSAFPNLRITGPHLEQARLPPLNTVVSDGDDIPLGSQFAKIIATPGHTLGHIAYWFESASVIATGDALFIMGCGRLFEGTPEMAYESMARFNQLPGETQIYCGHEYSEKNAQFALSVDPDNVLLKDRAEAIRHMRADGKLTTPSTIAIERETNPFMRCENRVLQKFIGMPDADPVEVFATLRAKRDVF